MSEITMAKNNPVLLITSSVHVAAPYVKVTDAQTRAQLILDSVGNWIRIAPQIKLVICDGSGYDFTAQIRQRFPTSDVECLFFQNDKAAVFQYGKGYGEGQIIEYAIDHSSHLAKSEDFAKCTGKLWVENYSGVLRGYRGQLLCQLHIRTLMSIRRIRPDFFDTRFYIVNKNFYNSYLRKAYLDVRDHHGYYLEHSFNDALIRNKLRVSDFLFDEPPWIAGVSGTLGEAYEKEDLKTRRIKNWFRSFMLRLHETIYGGTWWSEINH
jgi:hypothetical protein